MDKLTVFLFPAITFAIVTAGIIVYELGRYLGNLL